MLGQLLGGHLPSPWGPWAVTSPIVLLVPPLLGRRWGSRLCAMAVLLTLGWVFGLTLYVILTVTFRVMLAATTGSLRLGMNGDDLSSNAVENAPQDGVPPPWMITALP